jgi:integrase/recombinase XerD
MGRRFSISFPDSPKPVKSHENFLATLLAIMLQPRIRKRNKNAASKDQTRGMNLYAAAYGRKYLNVTERNEFAAAADASPPSVRLFCLMLLWTGCRISEALAITARSIDRQAGTVALLTLKRRKRRVIRQVPLPAHLIEDLDRMFDLSTRERDTGQSALRLWSWNRSTAWRHVKAVMKRANIPATAAMPKGLRHTFGVTAFQLVPPHIVQRWMGHASLRTTAIYGDVSGQEERLFAERIWKEWRR